MGRAQLGGQRGVEAWPVGLSSSVLAEAFHQLALSSLKKGGREGSLSKFYSGAEGVAVWEEGTRRILPAAAAVLRHREQPRTTRL